LDLWALRFRRSIRNRRESDNNVLEILENAGADLLY